MKKFLISVLSLAAVIACTKSETVYSDPQEIGFNPVNAKMTKAPVNSATFPTDYDITTFGYYSVSTNAGTAPTAFPANNANDIETYIPGATFKHEGNNIWHGDPTPYYWPKRGSIIFAGYANAAANNTISHTLANNFTATGYVQPAENSDDAKDLLFFDLTNSYSAGPVPATFIHALSWLTFKVKAGNDIAAANFKIKKIVLKGVVNKADLATDANVPTWTLSTSADDVHDITVFENTAGVAPTTTADLAQGGEDKVVIIPQGAKVVEITYVQADGTDAQGVTIWTHDQTTSVNLAQDLSDAQWNDKAAHNTWNYKSHYTYIFNFGLNEIKIAPKVDTWTEYTYDNITI